MPIYLGIRLFQFYGAQFTIDLYTIMLLENNSQAALDHSTKRGENVWPLSFMGRLKSLCSGRNPSLF